LDAIDFVADRSIVFETGTVCLDWPDLDVQTIERAEPLHEVAVIVIDEIRWYGIPERDA
jgi:hypothetical protein